MSAIKEKLHDQIEAGMRKIKIIPILFSTPMVNAILSGNKSMTRRKIKMQPGEGECYEKLGDNEFAYISKGGISGPYSCPYGQPDDVLWVREKWENDSSGGKWVEYYAGSVEVEHNRHYERLTKWKPSIHMPFDACRIFLRVKEIRVEKLLDISEDDAKCEGVKLHERGEKYLNYLDEKHNITQFIYNCKTAAHSFRTLWLVINGNGSLISNPWVWVISFERITDAAEIAEICKQWYERKSK